MQPRPLIFNPPPPPQFQSVWSSPNAETYMQPPTMMNPITQYVQVKVACILIMYLMVVLSSEIICTVWLLSDNTLHSLLEYFQVISILLLLSCS